MFSILNFLLLNIVKFGGIKGDFDNMECNIMIKGEYIAEIYKWYNEHALTVNRRYQRKLVWELEEKQKFIKTILDGYPVPLFLLVDTGKKSNSKTETKEIIDGLQRLEAIISFILNKYPVMVDGEMQYFNLDVYPGNSALLANGELHQESPAMDREICNEFLLYQLPISIMSANGTVVDDVFKRINSTGRKLSAQDLRQAGVTSKFSELVRIISTHVRGDASDDVVEMNEIDIYSLNSQGLNYGINVKEVFWVEQGIITEEALRRSKDEEMIAILCSSILSTYTSGMSVTALNRLYDVTSTVYENNEALLTDNSRFDDIIHLFSRIISDLTEIFTVKNTTFSRLLFKAKKNYNKDLVFIVLFLTLAQLYSENYYVSDYEKLGDALNNIADTEFSEIIRQSECTWNVNVRNHLIERLKNVLSKYMDFSESNPEWNKEFTDYLKQITTEKQLCDFKVGFHDLRNGSENNKLIQKCVKTLVAMANTFPNKEGVIVVGISDNDASNEDYCRHYNTTSVSYNNFYITGIVNEANKYYGSIDNFTCHVKDIIENDNNVTAEVKCKILTTMDTMRYGDQTLLVLKLDTHEPLFYGGKLFVRYQSHNHELAVGSAEFNEVMRKFYEKH